MLYCEKCQIAFDIICCPVCGGEKARQPRSSDPCFLVEKEILWGELLEEALKNNGIPVLVKKRMGIGMALKVGPLLERVQIYVPFSRLEDSKDIVHDLFSEKKGSCYDENA